MKKPAHPIVGAVVGLMLLTVAAIVQASTGSKPFDLPVPVWIVGLVPIGLGLITGGYLKNFKTPLISAEMEALQEVNPSAQSNSTPPQLPAADWTLERAAEYKRVDGYMLAHVYRLSAKHGQTFDIFIFLVRHKKGTDGPPRRHFSDIQKVEFFFGDSWGNRVFDVANNGGVLGIQTHAWGTFLATCRITFKDATRKPIVLHRYIDFHMLHDTPPEA
nr:hypothetical protein [Nitrospirota bacterium]